MTSYSDSLRLPSSAKLIMMIEEKYTLKGTCFVKKNCGGAGGATVTE